MRRSTWLLILALCLAGATALPAHGGASAPEVLFTAKNRSITAPAVAGSTVAWISGPKGRPGECVNGRKRLQLLGANGKVRVLTHRRGRNYETSCLYRPILEGRFIMWSTPAREFIWARQRGQRRGWKSCCGQDIAHHHDITRTGDVTWLRDRGGRYWPRWIGADGEETPVWVDIDRTSERNTLMGSRLSTLLPDGFEGMDAADTSIVVRIKAAGTYSLIRVDATTGATTNLVTGAKQLSLPAVANDHAAYLRRDGNRERIELVNVLTGEITEIGSRAGKATWGRGQIVAGRPLDYDGNRIVLAAGRRVLSFDAPTVPAAGVPSIETSAKLAFESLGSLVVASADGSSDTKLGKTEASFDAPSATWSPDGSQLALVRNRDLYVVSADGTGARRLDPATGRESAPNWSPDGSAILFERHGSGRTSLRSVEPTGSNARDLTAGIRRASSAAWSPDGTRIAFIADEGRRPVTTSIYVMNADGGGKLKLATSGSGNRFLSLQLLSWSADGMRIAYTTFGRSSNIVTVKADGSGTPSILIGTDRADSQPAFSSTGALAFVSTRNGNPELYVANGDGTNQTRLTASPGSENSPKWSADGALIAYGVSHLTRTSELYVIAADSSSGPARLTAPAGSVGEAAWQPLP